jgi:hypothetical protein
MALVTFIHPGQGGVDESRESGWVYPQCVAYAPEIIAEMIDRGALFGRTIPWFHPRQTWYVLAKDPSRLPGPEVDHCLRGAILNVPEWHDSI